MEQKKTLIIGAGPSGMGCAHTLSLAGQNPLVVEKDDLPGGLCKTIDFYGYLFDIGGHRFISKSEEVNELWRKFMHDDMIRVKRLSRIFYKKRFFKYPVSFFDTFCKLNPVESLWCIFSYLRCKHSKPGDDSTFEGWVINRFGEKLYNVFFKPYTEKIWAMACRDISADWAEQRIRGLSLKVALRKALFSSSKNMPKTLSEEFLYPRMGPGEFYRRLKDSISLSGGQFEFGKSVVGIKHRDGKIISVETRDSWGGKKDMEVEYLFSSVPLPILVKLLAPRLPEIVISAADNLKFRSLLIVNIIVDKENVFSDQWIYVHSPDVRLGRIQNYKNWSPAMVPDLKKTSLGLEYFCTENDDLWKMNNVDLISYATEELEKIGMINRKHLISGFVVRCPDAYPIYSIGYERDVQTVKKHLSEFINLQTMGRAGLFRYDNSDHALLTGISAAKNFLGDSPCNIWDINTDEKYLES